MKGSDKLNSETGLLDNRRDLLTIEIYKYTGKEKTVLSEGFGSYLEQITFTEGKNEQTLWTINDDHLSTQWAVPEDKSLILESDSSMRLDLIKISNEEWDSAEK